MTIDERAEIKTNRFSYRYGYSTAKDAYIEGYKDCQSTFDNLPKIKAWITRNENGDIYMHTESPDFDGSLGIWYTGRNNLGIYLSVDQLPECCIPKWEDEEPIEVELTIKAKQL